MLNPPVDGYNEKKKIGDEQATILLSAARMYRDNLYHLLHNNLTSFHRSISSSISWLYLYLFRSLSSSTFVDISIVSLVLWILC